MLISFVPDSAGVLVVVVDRSTLKINLLTERLLVMGWRKERGREQLYLYLLGRPFWVGVLGWQQTPVQQQLSRLGCSSRALASIRNVCLRDVIGHLIREWIFIKTALFLQTINSFLVI